MKKTLLEKAIKERTLIGIRTSMIEWDESIIGFIVDLDESYFTINEIDEYGFPIGNTQIAIEDVISINIDDRYQKRLKYVYDNNSMFDVNRRVTVWKEGEKLIPNLKELAESKQIATLFLSDDNYIIGCILKYDKTHVMIKNVGSEGDEDGVSYHPINEFIGLRYNSIKEQKIKLLYENKNYFY